MTTKLVKAYERLYNGIDDMVESGHLDDVRLALAPMLADIEDEKDAEHLAALYPPEVKHER